MSTNPTNICRACLQKDPTIKLTTNHKKFSMKYSEMLYHCTTVQADISENLICKKCTSILIKFYKYRLLVIENDTKFKQAVELFTKKTDDNINNHTNVIEIAPVSDNEPITPDNNKLIETKENLEENNELNCDNFDNDDFGEENNAATNDEIIQNKVRKKLRSKNVGQTYQCEICGSFLKCKSSLVQHKQRHSGEKPFSCTMCEKSFRRSEHLVVHKRIHTGERPHQCSICSKRFVQYAALSAHLRIHSGERPYLCPICGKAFSQAISLTYHTRTHTGETPFKCKICGKGFAHSGNLNIHMRFHRNERPHQCNMCGRRFVTSSHLTVHIKQHIGEKSHQCNQCGKAFVRSEHLKDHMVIHTGQKPYSCLLCPKKYTQSGHLSRHMKSHKGKEEKST